MLPLDLVGRIAAQTGSALHAAHQEGVFHRDLKPSNIFLCRQGDYTDVVKVLDFGISKIQGAQRALTRTNAVMGTPLYMSPEQARGMAARVDARTDIYALGSIIYEMLAGRPPFSGQTPDVLLYQVVHELPEPLRMLRAEVSFELEQTVMRALAKDREERFSSARAFVDEVSRCLEQMSSAVYPKAPSALEPTQPPQPPPNLTAPLEQDRDQPTGKTTEEEPTVQLETLNLEDDGHSTDPDNVAAGASGNASTFLGVGQFVPPPPSLNEGTSPKIQAPANVQLEPQPAVELGAMPTLPEDDLPQAESRPGGRTTKEQTAPIRLPDAGQQGEASVGKQEHREGAGSFWIVAGSLVVVLVLGAAWIFNPCAGPTPSPDMGLSDRGRPDGAADLRSTPDVARPDTAHADTRRRQDTRIPPPHKKPQFGTLRVRARIVGQDGWVHAPIFVDGRPKGETPMPIRIRAGRYLLVVRHPLKRTVAKRVVHVPPNKVKLVTIEFKR